MLKKIIIILKGLKSTWVTKKKLTQMNEHMLRDIGINRNDIN